MSDALSLALLTAGFVVVGVVSGHAAGLPLRRAWLPTLLGAAPLTGALVCGLSAVLLLAVGVAPRPVVVVGLALVLATGGAVPAPTAARNRGPSGRDRTRYPDWSPRWWWSPRSCRSPAPSCDSLPPALSADGTDGTGGRSGGSRLMRSTSTGVSTGRSSSILRTAALIRSIRFCTLRSPRCPRPRSVASTPGWWTS